MMKTHSKRLEKASMEDDWQVQSDLRAILAAREIQEDAKRMARVRKLAAEKAADMAKISQKAS